MEYLDIFNPYDGFPRYKTCGECGKEYSVDWIQCPFCHSQYADHIIIRMKPGSKISNLKLILEHRADIDNISVVRNMKPDHNGFKYVTCINCGISLVTPEERVCFSCVENVKHGMGDNE